jgi:hypothetical protein
LSARRLAGLFTSTPLIDFLACSLLRSKLLDAQV